MLFRALLPLLLVATMFAQSEDIFHRVRLALASSGSGEIAVSALSRHDFASAERLLATVHPDSDAGRSEVLALQGAVKFLAGEMRPAVVCLQQASTLAPLRDADTFTLAMALVNLQDQGHARPLLNALAAKHPGQVLYIYWLGRIDYSERRYPEAVDKLTRASRLDPASPRIWNSLGLAFDMQGSMDQALPALRKAADLNRNLPHPSPWPPHDLGFLLLRMDKPNEAEAALRESLRYDPNLSQAHYHLGRVLEKETRETEAIEEYRSAVTSDASSADACYSLGILYRKLHRDKESDAMFVEYRKRRKAPEPLAGTQ